MNVIAKVVSACFCIFALGIALGVVLVKSYQAGPGHTPTDVFLDESDTRAGKEWYSQDGCWHLQDGYWRPLRRCHIVRIPAP